MDRTFDASSPMWPWQEFMKTFPIEYCRQHQILGVMAVDESDPIAGAIVTSEVSLRTVDTVGRMLGNPLPTVLVEDSELRATKRCQRRKGVRTRF